MSLPASRFAVRILELDAYTTRPNELYDETYSVFRACAPPQVPVIRVFGVTPAGQKVCAHVHGIYPYFYIPWWQPEPPAAADLRDLAANLDQALHRALQKKASRAACLVAAVTPICKTSFYGYHQEPDLFLKIELYNPFLVLRAADLLQEGVVDGKRHQPYEAHIPYMLQFMADYNLQGMNFIFAAAVTFREPLPPAAATTSASSQTSTASPLSQQLGRRHHRENIRDEDIHNAAGRVSKCELEVDFHRDAILNHHTLPSPNLAAPDAGATPVPQNPGLTALWDDERLRRQARGENPRFTPPPEFARPRPPHPALSVNERRFQDLLQASAAADRLAVVDDVALREIGRHLGPNASATQPSAAGSTIESNPSQSSLEAALALAGLFAAPATHEANLDQKDLSDDKHQAPELDNARWADEDWDSVLHDDFEDALGTAGTSPHDVRANKLPEPNASRRGQMLQDEEDDESQYMSQTWSEEVHDFLPSNSVEGPLLAAPTPTYSVPRAPVHDATPGSAAPHDEPEDSDTGSEDDGQVSSDVVPDTASEGSLPPPVGPQTPPLTARRSAGQLQGLPTHETNALYAWGFASPPPEDRIPSPPCPISPVPSPTHVQQEHRATNAVSTNSVPAARPIARVSAPESALSLDDLVSDSSTPTGLGHKSSAQSHDALAWLAPATIPPSSHTATPVRSLTMPRAPTTEVIAATLPIMFASLPEPAPSPSLSPSPSPSPSPQPVPTPGFRAWRFATPPPAPSTVAQTLRQRGLDEQIHQAPYFSDRADMPQNLRNVDGSRQRFAGPFGTHLTPFHSTTALSGLTRGPSPRRPLPGTSLDSAHRHSHRYAHGFHTKRFVFITPARAPPTCSHVAGAATKVRMVTRGRAEAHAYLPQPSVRAAGALDLLSLGSSVSSAGPIAATPSIPHAMSAQLSKNDDPYAAGSHARVQGPANAATFGFDLATQHLSDATLLQAQQHVTVVSLELHSHSQGARESDPRHDPILALILCAWFDDTIQPLRQRKLVLWWGAADTEPEHERWGLPNFTGVRFDSEELLLRGLVDRILRWDPEVLVGYEVQMRSWGYLVERGWHLGVDVCMELSRIHEQPTPEKSRLDPHGYHARKTSELRVPGRILLNLWRIMRHELALTSYSFENICYHVLHRRVAHVRQQQLRDWYQSASTRHRWRTLHYLGVRAEGSLQLLYELNIIQRTSEFARLFGILFNEVLTRGSQFRVESIMVRLAHQRDQIMLSPSKVQVREQRAPEVVALILEPESVFYESPVVVLDFQSLYPSMMIAYNMCYSTCLGKVPAGTRKPGEPFKFGVSDLQLPPGLLSRLVAQDLVHICPNGTMFVKSEVRHGVLPVMLDEILRTRVMVKKAMGGEPAGGAAHRLMNARQLGLKLIANVTYGYTAATFSGRMPCVDIADAIVQQARETLTKAMKVVETHPDWHAKVVYGDTDSMFVLLPGATKETAFRIGREMAATISAQYPAPVRLKFEKVYLPCILQTKKRYVGYMYETETQTEPVFDAKGIETVRRDWCPAVTKTLERSLRILFEKRDLSLLRAYLTREWIKLLKGEFNLTDYIFAKAYRGRESYSSKACVAALEIANKRARVDPRAEPRVGERVPYVIVCGPPKATLITLVRQPDELLSDSSLRLNAHYYIRKQIIPPLERCFNLLGLSVIPWYTTLPRVERAGGMVSDMASHVHNRHTLSQFYASAHCIVCDALTRGRLCSDCHRDPQRSVTILMARVKKAQDRLSVLDRICRRCMHAWNADPDACCSLACPVMFERRRQQQRLDVALPIYYEEFGDPDPPVHSHHP